MNEEKKEGEPGKKPEGITLTEEQNKMLDFFLTTPLRSANRLMEQLYRDDHFYETAAFAWVGPQDAKKFFLYGVCKEVLKACIDLMQDKEVLQETPSENADRMSKIVSGSITDGQTYRIRKLTELLSLMILFHRDTKRDEEYRVYLSAENMDLALSRQKDFRDLYEERSISNVQYSIDDYADRIARDLKELGVSDLWFLDNKKVQKKKNPGIFRSKKDLFLAALLVANADERLALGISYGRGYSRASQSMHPLLGSHDYGKRDNDTKHIVGNFTHLSLIAMHIMHLAFKLAGLEDPDGLAKVMGPNFEKSEASKALAGLQKDLEIGDLVLTAWSDLAEVIDSHTSKYGYKAYKIRYLLKPPLPEFPEDWLEAQNVTARLMTKSWARPFLEKNTPSLDKMPKEVADIWPEVMKQPDETLMKSAVSFFVDMHKHGVLIPMLLESGFLKKRTLAEF